MRFAAVVRAFVPLVSGILRIKKLDFGPVCGQPHALSMPSICKPMTSKSTNFRFIGQPIPRTEDARLLTGRGQFSDDFSFPGQTYAVMVRSPHAHARIVRIDTAAAKKMPGVIGVFTGSDCLADGLNPIPHDPLPKTKYDMKFWQR